MTLDFQIALHTNDICTLNFMMSKSKAIFPNFCACRSVVMERFESTKVTVSTVFVRNRFLFLFNSILILFNSIEFYLIDLLG